MRAELQPLRVSCSSSRRVAAPIAELYTYARVARCNRRVARASLSCNLNPELQPHLGGQLQEVRYLLRGPSCTSTLRLVTCRKMALSKLRQEAGHARQV